MLLNACRTAGQILQKGVQTYTVNPQFMKPLSS